MNGAVTHKLRAKRGIKDAWGQYDKAVTSSLPHMYGWDINELVFVGHWVPIEVDYLGQADELRIVAIPDPQTIELSDGSQTLHRPAVDESLLQRIGMDEPVDGVPE